MVRLMVNLRRMLKINRAEPRDLQNIFSIAEDILSVAVKIRTFNIFYEGIEWCQRFSRT